MEKKQIAATLMSCAAIATILAGIWANGSAARQNMAPIGTTSTTFSLPDSASRQATSVLNRSKAASTTPRLEVESKDGLLTVDVQDAELGEVLTAITRAVGMQFDVEGDARERLTFKAPPGPVREVMTALLDRASFSYAFVNEANALSVGSTGSTGRMILVRRGVPLRAAATSVNAATAATAIDRGAATNTARPPVSPEDESAVQRQRATDALFDACRASACDSS